MIPFFLWFHLNIRHIEQMCILIFYFGKKVLYLSKKNHILEIPFKRTYYYSKVQITHFMNSFSKINFGRFLMETDQTTSEDKQPKSFQKIEM